MNVKFVWYDASTRSRTSSEKEELNIDDESEMGRAFQLKRLQSIDYRYGHHICPTDI